MKSLLPILLLTGCSLTLSTTKTETVEYSEPLCGSPIVKNQALYPSFTYENGDKMLILNENNVCIIKAVK